MAFASLAGLFFLWGKCLALSSFSSADLNFKMMLEEKGGREDRQIYLGCPLQSDIGVDRGGKIGDRRPKIKTRVGGKSKMQRGKFEQIFLLSFVQPQYLFTSRRSLILHSGSCVS